MSVKRLLVAATLLTFFLTPAASFAQTVSPTPTPIPTREDARARKLERAISQEARFCELRKTKIKSYFERMTKRLEALITRLQKLIDRIQSRIDKIDTTDSQADLDNAKAKLTSAKVKLDTLKAEIDSFLVCEDPKAEFKTVRGKVEEIKKDLKEVHQILVHIIGSIKGLRVGETEKSPKPTPTPTI